MVCPAPGPVGRFSFNPLVIGNVMYVVGKDMGVYALDATTGKQIWAHAIEGGQPTNRGFNYWSSKDGKDQRLIFAVDSYMQEIDAKTGKSILSFGTNGRVNLREGVGRDPATIGDIQNGTPGRVFENLIILGSAPGEMYDSPPGDLRAYDVHTGKIVWTFHTIPHPGEFGYDTMPPDAWKYVGGANTWGEISLDVKRGIAYFPLGSPTYDLYGADRKGANLFGDCLLALDARTGKRLWHFQLVHHDLWDYRPDCRAEAFDGAPRWQDGRCGRACGQDWISLCLRPCNWTAAMAYRGASCSEVGYAGRRVLAHAAFPDRSATFCAATIHTERHQSLSGSR